MLEITFNSEEEKNQYKESLFSEQENLLCPIANLQNCNRLCQCFKKLRGGTVSLDNGYPMTFKIEKAKCNNNMFKIKDDEIIWQ